MKHYLIGDVAKLLPISKDTLRYYDKLGIVSPTKSNTNGYRYYTKDDLLALSYVLILRDLEVPLEEIKERLSNNTLDDFKELLNRQESMIDDKLSRLLKLKESIYYFQKDIITAQTDYRKIECVISPTFVYKSLATEFDSNYADILTEMEKDTLICAPNFSAILSQDTFFTQRCFDLFAISGIVKSKQEMTTLKDYNSFKSTLCIHTVLIIGQQINQDDLDALFTYLKTHRLTLAGDILARYIAFEHHNGIPTEYYELFIPVKATKS